MTYHKAPEAILNLDQTFSVLRVAVVNLNEIMVQTRIILDQTIISTVQNKLLFESSKFRIHCEWKQIRGLKLTPTVECFRFRWSDDMDVSSYCRKNFEVFVSKIAYVVLIMHFFFKKTLNDFVAAKVTFFRKKNILEASGFCLLNDYVS